MSLELYLGINKISPTCPCGSLGDLNARTIDFSSPCGLRLRAFERSPGVRRRIGRAENRNSIVVRNDQPDGVVGRSAGEGVPAQREGAARIDGLRRDVIGEARRVGRTDCPRQRSGATAIHSPSS